MIVVVQREQSRGPEEVEEYDRFDSQWYRARVVTVLFLWWFFFGVSNVLFRIKIYSKNTHIMMWDLSPSSSSHDWLYMTF